MPGKDRHVVDVSIHARELSGAQVKDRARCRAGKVDCVVSARVMDHETDIMLQARRGEFIAILRAAKAIDIVAGVQVDGLIGPHPIRVDG